MPRSIIVAAGRHARYLCPVRMPWPGADAPPALAADGRTFPTQRDGDDLVFLAPPLAPDQTVSLSAVGRSDVSDGVSLEDRDGRIDVSLPDGPLTSYLYEGNPARPCFHPVMAPGGVAVTRNWPLVGGVAGETTDHPHQRSMWIAHGAVNGVDNWSHEGRHGRTLHRSIDELVSGPVFGRFRTTGAWTDHDGREMLRQALVATFWRGSDRARLIDIDVTLTAVAGDVLLGDTKEGGMLAARVASEMDVPRTGRIENSYGGIDEGETWGRSAHWCDYSGKVDGHPVGIAVMDHPVSFRYPTYWHVRNYGLMAANPFALNDYTDGLKNGDHLMRDGSSLRFVYRVLLHSGSAEQADVRAHYLGFVSPPRVEAR